MPLLRVLDGVLGDRVPGLRGVAMNAPARPVLRSPSSLRPTTKRAERFFDVGQRRIGLIASWGNGTWYVRARKSAFRLWLPLALVHHHGRAHARGLHVLSLFVGPLCLAVSWGPRPAHDGEA